MKAIYEWNVLYNVKIQSLRMLIDIIQEIDVKYNSIFNGVQQIFAETFSKDLQLVYSLAHQVPFLWHYTPRQNRVSNHKQAKMAAIYSLYIINKSGGLIFYKVSFPRTHLPTHWHFIFCSLSNQDSCEMFIRITVPQEEWTLMTAWDWRVYGTQCTPSLSSCSLYLDVWESSSSKRTPLISIVFSRSPVIKFPLFASYFLFNIFLHFPVMFIVITFMIFVFLWVLN